MTSTLNRVWHTNHRMPERATFEQRVVWHGVHAAVCGCRKPPKAIMAELEKRRSVGVPQTPPRISALQHVRGSDGGNANHNRGIERFDMVLRSAGLATLGEQVATRLARRKRIRVLEIGCGEGRLLLDLLKRFGDAIELHGVNAPLWPVMSSPRELRETNARYRVMRDSDLKNARFPPRIHLADAQDLLSLGPLRFDFVISQMVLPHVVRKDLVLEESIRLLAPNGVMVEELEQMNPDVVEVGGPDLPRFVVLRGSTRLSTTAFLRSRGFGIHFARHIEKCDSVIVTYQRKGPALRLGLRFDEASTTILRSRFEFERRLALWGVRSVYRT